KRLYSCRGISLDAPSAHVWFSTGPPADGELLRALRHILQRQPQRSARARHLSCQRTTVVQCRRAVEPVSPRSHNRPFGQSTPSWFSGLLCCFRQFSNELLLLSFPDALHPAADEHVK